MDIGINEKDRKEIAEGLSIYWLIPTHSISDTLFPLECDRSNVPDLAFDV